MSAVKLAAVAVVFGWAAPAMAGPVDDPGPAELAWVMDRLQAWLPGAWDSYPQVYHERTVRMPAGGEHEHWHRSFALIQAPQVGEVVFYGQINVGGRDGPLLPRSQVVYSVHVDAARGAVVMNGQPPADPERFVDLGDHPELWGQVRMRDPAALNCDFLWRRHGQQLVGVLDGKSPERRRYGPGTCNYVMRGSDAEFYADAEWVLGPEDLWVYDINKVRGQLFVGRADRTHVRLFRARPYRCAVRDAAGSRQVDAHDRGFRYGMTAGDGQQLGLWLLRAEYPAGEAGLADRLRLWFGDAAGQSLRALAEAPPQAAEIAVEAEGLAARCELQATWPPPAVVTSP